MTNTLNYEELVAQVAALTKRCEALSQLVQQAIAGSDARLIDGWLARARAALESNDGRGT